jgi:hypothetical protein
MNAAVVSIVVVISVFAKNAAVAPIADAINAATAAA